VVAVLTGVHELDDAFRDTPHIRASGRLLGGIGPAVGAGASLGAAAARGRGYAMRYYSSSGPSTRRGSGAHTGQHNLGG